MSEKKLDVLSQFRTERDMKYKNGLYSATQIDFAYNSNHMEGSRLTERDTRYIYETHSFIVDEQTTIHINDVIETQNHFRCFDYLLDIAQEALAETHIKEFHRILKRGSLDADKPYFNVGDYKSHENTVGNIETMSPEKVPEAMRNLLESYHYIAKEYPSENASERLQRLLDFHVRFERIHPFQDGNGRVGRLVMFKECIANDIMPFVIEDKNRLYYMRGIENYHHDRTQFTETIKHEQEIFAARFEKYAFPAEDEKIGIIRSPERDLCR